MISDRKRGIFFLKVEYAGCGGVSELGSRLTEPVKTVTVSEGTNSLDAREVILLVFG